MRVPASFALTFVATAAIAQDFNTPADITFTCNAHGAVVHLPDTSKIFLGKECDAYQPGLGTGRWYFAAAAFLVEINGETLRFANDIPCDVPYCQYVPE